ncbi:MAG: hypothetical protein HOP30_02845 [Cyclobacteriaceae bacterium]|nr:hypothetical protein [Cyclobacteriaceae bacterium]
MLTFLFNGFELPAFHYQYLFLLIPYLAAMYFYAGLFNHDVVVHETGIEIVNRVPLFKKTTKFEFASIQSITLRHDWTETFGTNFRIPWIKSAAKELALLLFPWDYKWIKIVTDQEYKFYCFGIEYDCYDNEGPVFEDLFSDLTKHYSHVKWTSIQKNMKSE